MWSTTPQVLMETDGGAPAVFRSRSLPRHAITRSLSFPKLSTDHPYQAQRKHQQTCENPSVLTHLAEAVRHSEGHCTRQFHDENSSYALPQIAPAIFRTVCRTAFVPSETGDSADVSSTPAAASMPENCYEGHLEIRISMLYTTGWA
jgi:hypothetical protein